MSVLFQMAKETTRHLIQLSLYSSFTKDRLFMQVCQAHKESVFVWKSIVVSAVSEHGSANFRECNLRLGSSNEHCGTLCGVVSCKNVSNYL